MPWSPLVVNVASVGVRILVRLGWSKNHIAALGIVLRNRQYKGVLVNISSAFGLFVGYADEGAIMLLGHSFNLILNAWTRGEVRASMIGEGDGPWGFRVQGV